MSKKNRKNNETNTAPVADETLNQELEALLDDATAIVAEADAEAANDPIVEGADELDMDAIEAAATAESIKEAAYAEQSADEADESATASTVTPITAAKKSSTPRVSRAAGAKASQVLASAVNDDDLLKVACLVSGDKEDPALVEALKDNVDGLAKKVGNKAVNLLRHMSNPGKLESYTRKALDFIIAKKSVSSKDLVEHLQSSGYTIGTARSQANQIMSLFPALRVTDKTGRTLALNPDSNIVSAYQAATAAA